MPRTPTQLDALAERYLDEQVALDPLEATYLGLAGHDTEMPDLSPEGFAEQSALRRRTLAELSRIEPQDDTDSVTRDALRERLDVAEQLREIGADEADLKVIASPLQGVRDVFDVMPTATADDWATVATRMAAIPAALSGYAQSLRDAAGRGNLVAKRQVRAGIDQCRDTIEFFSGLGADAELPSGVRADLERGRAGATESYDRLRQFLRDELEAVARDEDAVGQEQYAVHSRASIGSVIDLAETYAWGQDVLAEIDSEMAATAERIRPGASAREAMDVLDADPARRLHGTTALQRWMQETSDAAVAALAGTHFDIPEEIRTLECRIAPTHSGGIYYTGPSEDLSRPGRMWWAVPEGVESFGTWRERTTVYHEGVPGHHLQIAQTVLRRDELNRWRRLASWLSGHGEGWALYAERLMGELGFHEDPGNYLGMLDAQGMRAARVVIDIGVHCRFPAPVAVGGGEWTYDKAWQVLTAHSAMAEPVLRFELDRYLGWPGQAPSYKVGERLWLALREDARRAAEAAGQRFDLVTFHRRALDVGSVGMDVLRRAVLG